MRLDLNRVEEPFVMELKNKSGNTCILDANPAIGGLGKGFRPMELLAGSLAGCVSIDVINILRKQRVKIKHYAVRIEALRSDGVPSIFENIRLIFEFDKGIDETRIRKVIELTLEKYCSVSASLKEEVKISYDVVIIE